MTRWLTAIVAVLLVLAGGYLVFLNSEPVVVRLTPTRTASGPLAGALIIAFTAGAVVVALLWITRAGARGVRNFRTRRRMRREARRAESTARAHALVQTGEYQQARVELLRDGEEIPTDPARLVLLAETFLQEGEPAAGRALLERGLSRGLQDPRLMDLLADACERTGDVHAATTTIERARLAEPTSLRLSRRLRDLYVRHGRAADALALQGEIVLAVRAPAALASEERVLRALRYEVALTEPDPTRAARTLAAIAREDPDFLPASVSAGDAYLKAGRRFRARRAWERGARRRPAVVLLERLERLNADDGQPRRTERLYLALERLHPGVVVVPLLHARALIDAAQYGAAAAILRGLPAAEADRPAAQRLWGEFHRRQGQHEDAAAAFARAVGAGVGLGTPYRCTSCGTAASQWAAHCERCRRWDTLRTEVEQPVAGA